MSGMPLPQGLPSNLPSLPLTPLFPLLSARALDEPLAWRHGHAVSAAQFTAQAQALALSLPAGRPVNLCQDRLHLALGLAAALLRGQTSLMPPNALPPTLRQLAAGGEAVYALIDGGEREPGDRSQAPDLGGLTLVPVALLPGLADVHQVPQVAASQAAVCLLTSGSTGTPQPHAKAWGQLVLNIDSEARRLAQGLGLPSLRGLTLVATVPGQHSYGLESTVLLAMLGGAAFDAGRPFYPADIAMALQQVPQPRALVTTPFHLKTLLQSGVALPTTELTLCATAPLSPQLAQQAEVALGGQLVEIYGCTEAGQVASRRTTAGEVWTTLGDLWLRHETQAGVEAFVVEGGHVLAPTPLADVLELLDERRFRLLGRANDLIHVAGKRSSLAHLNFHLNRIDGVQDGAFWLPDADGEQGDQVVRPVAFVVAPGLSAQAIIRALRQQLEGAFVPRKVVQVAALPREDTGKLSSAAWRDFALRTLADLAANSRLPPASPALLPVLSPLTLTALPSPTPLRTELLLQVPLDHAAFAGHFPGRPILPGAALLALVLRALGEQAALKAWLGERISIDSAKFLWPLGPGASLRLIFTPQGSGLAFEVHAVDGGAQRIAARGQLSALGAP